MFHNKNYVQKFKLFKRRKQIVKKKLWLPIVCYLGLNIIAKNFWYKYQLLNEQDGVQDVPYQKFVKM